MDDGRNPMRWDCERNGCFNKVCRPKIEIFSPCFPGRINFGDVDGVVEIKGCFCFLEWKGEGGEIKTGQRILFEQFTKVKGNAVFVVEGDAESMKVDRYCRFKLGAKGPWKKATLEEVKSALRGWVAEEMLA